ncbi:MAG TPA: hypothetical protein VN914_04870 [Polyangia bacterium]|nr:hypothetical protein [Polyangia bacterium]
MALAGGSWRNGGSDLHLVRPAANTPTRKVFLGNIFQVNWAITDPVTGNVTSRGRFLRTDLPKLTEIPEISGPDKITFEPLITFTKAKHGITVAADGTVEISEAPTQIPPGLTRVPLVRNFIVNAVVKHTSTRFPSPLRFPIRIHLHGSVLGVELSPPELTAPQDAEVRFTVLAKFDDQVIGNITNRTGLASDFTWDPVRDDDSPAEATVVVKNQTTGVVTTSGPTPQPGNNIRLTLPGDLDGKIARGRIRHATGWATVAPKCHFIRGPGISRREEVPNFLFLSEGFVPDDLLDFPPIAWELIQYLRHEPSAMPFSRDRSVMPAFNFFRAAIPSRESGMTVAPEIFLDGQGKDPSTEKTKFVDSPRRPQAPNADNPGTGPAVDLQTLIYKVGLPVLDDAALDPDQQHAEWEFIYGPGYVGPLDNDFRGRASEWIVLLNRTIAHERDTRFGVQAGLPPQVGSTETGTTGGLNPLRARRRADLDTMLAAMTVDGPDGTVDIGKRWVSGGANPSPDAGRVILLVAGAKHIAFAARRVDNIVVLGLSDKRTVLLDPLPANKVIRPIHPYPITQDVSTFTRATLVHELGHTFGCDDEYGLSSRAGSSAPPTTAANVQTEKELTDLDPGPKLILAKNIRWNLPRIRAAGVLATAPVEVAKPIYRITLKRRHGRSFAGIADHQRVQLRNRPLRKEFIAPSVDLEILSRNGDEFTVEAKGAFKPEDWAGANPFLPAAIMFAPVRPNPTADSKLLIHQEIAAKIDQFHRPLNRTPDAADATCDPFPLPVIRIGPPKPNVQEVELFRPQDISPKHGSDLSRLIGLFDGGNEYPCGVFHPSGICTMRDKVTALLPNDPEEALPEDVVRNSLAPFCHVCRYILVDALDPRLHALIDTEYEKRYP